MGIQYEGDSNDEILRLVRENNRMLKSMRRSSLFGAIFKTILYLALLLIPLWFYVEYVAPMMESMLQMYSQIQGTNAQAQSQLGQFNGYLQQFQSMFGGGQ